MCGILSIEWSLYFWRPYHSFFVSRWSGVLLFRPEWSTAHQHCSSHECGQTSWPSLLCWHTLHPASILPAALHWLVAFFLFTVLPFFLLIFYIHWIQWMFLIGFFGKFKMVIGIVCSIWPVCTLVGGPVSLGTLLKFNWGISFSFILWGMDHPPFFLSLSVFPLSISQLSHRSL